ncbi:site-specific integrase, partial [bacterium]
YNMAKATPKLEQRKETKTGVLKQSNVPILIDFSFDGNRIWLQSGENIDRNKWDEKNHRVKPNVIGSVEINAIIASKCEQINKIYRDMVLANKTPTTAALRNALNSDSPKDKKSLFQHFDDFIDSHKVKSTLSTVKKLQTNKKHLVEFSKIYSFHPDFEQIDSVFFNKYTEFFLKHKKHTNSTINKNIKIFKWFMNYCTNMGYNKNYTYKAFNFKAIENEIIALTGEELMSIFNLQTDNLCLAQVRDCFCFMCFTALRYSDAKEVRKSDVSNGFINITSLKTKSQVIIPLIDETKALLDRYKNNFGTKAMPFISNQKMNEYLKQVGKLAGLNRVINKVRFRGSQRIEKSFKLYEVLTCHVGRKTFVSYMFSRNVDSELIRSISNHKSISSFARYNSISDEHKAREMKLAFKEVG